MENMNYIPEIYIDKVAGNWFINSVDTGVHAQGPAGITPHIGCNGNWFIGEEDTGVGATGPKGEKGDQGAIGPQGMTGAKDLAWLGTGKLMCSLLSDRYTD